MAKVTCKYATEHFLILEEAVNWARNQSALLQGKFTIWEDDGQGEIVTFEFENGRRVR